ncbi:unnamed protein product, partial [marine sediment metagenome]
DLCKFAKMPYISQQQKRPIFWEEMTPENEKNRSCAVETPLDLDESSLNKYHKRARRDLREGIKNGLKIKLFKYQYEQ